MRMNDISPAICELRTFLDALESGQDWFLPVYQTSREVDVKTWVVVKPCKQDQTDVLCESQVNCKLSLTFQTNILFAHVM